MIVKLRMCGGGNNVQTSDFCFIIISLMCHKLTSEGVLRFIIESSHAVTLYPPPPLIHHI